MVDENNDDSFVKQQKIFTLCNDDICEFFRGEQLLMSGTMIDNAYILKFTIFLPNLKAAAYGNVLSHEELK